MTASRDWPRSEERDLLSGRAGYHEAKRSPHPDVACRSLPRPEALLEVNRPKLTGEAYDEKLYAERLSAAVEEMCRKQAEPASM